MILEEIPKESFHSTDTAQNIPVTRTLFNIVELLEFSHGTCAEASSSYLTFAQHISPLLYKSLSLSLPSKHLIFSTFFTDKSKDYFLAGSIDLHNHRRLLAHYQTASIQIHSNWTGSGEDCTYFSWCRGKKNVSHVMSFGLPAGLLGYQVSRAIGEKLSIGSEVFVGIIQPSAAISLAFRRSSIIQENHAISVECNPVMGHLQITSMFAFKKGLVSSSFIGNIFSSDSDLRIACKIFSTDTPSDTNDYNGNAKHYDCESKESSLVLKGSMEEGFGISIESRIINGLRLGVSAMTGPIFGKSQSCKLKSLPLQGWTSGFHIDLHYTN